MRVRARSQGGARSVRAAAACSREGGVSFRAPAGYRRVQVYARWGARGCEEGKCVTRGAGSTCLQTHGGSLCSEDTQAPEGM